MSPRRAPLILGIVGVLLVAAIVTGALVFTSGGDDQAVEPTTTTTSTTPSPTPSPEPKPPPPVLAPDDGSGTAPTPAGVAAALGDGLTDTRLGSRIAARVVDVQSGTTLLDHRGTATATPASTTKVLTGIATLASLPDDQRFTTRVMRGQQPGSVVLVGGGDATLTAAGPGEQPSYTGAARLADLAAAVKAAIKEPITAVVVDGSRYGGATFAPGWDSDAVSGGYTAPITGLMVDGGRERPGYVARSQEPDLAAGQAFARALGVPNASVTRGTAPQGAKELASVQSPPLVDIVDEMLTSSDNTLAECLGREVAVATGEPATFAGAGAAVRAQVGKLGVAADGVRLSDTSGLSRENAISPAALTGALQAAATGRPELRQLFLGLPVGGFDGTLDRRYRAGAPARAAGQVRAKTGSLSGVSSLAGVVADDDGRLLAFAFLADQVPPGGTYGAEDALDELAAKLAGCGCH